MQNPTIGRIVHYKLSEQDVEAIGRARFTAIRGTFNDVTAGQVYPALVVRTFGGGAANLQVHLDGPDTYWATSRGEGEATGQWIWPPHV